MLDWALGFLEGAMIKIYASGMTEYRVVYEIDGNGCAPDMPWIHLDMIENYDTALQEYYYCVRTLSKRNANIWIEKRSGWEKVDQIHQS